MSSTHLYQSRFNINIQKTLIKNYEKILVVISPVIPHFANQCLKEIGTKNLAWPVFDETILKEEHINIVIQINGKKRGLLKTKPNVSEENLLASILKDEKLLKYLEQENIKRKIYIKNKLINIII